MFEIFLTDHAGDQLNKLKCSRNLQKRYKAVCKIISLLSENPRHPSLQNHEFTSLKGPENEKVFEAYAEQSTSSAYRIFWYYGPKKGWITIISIIPHP